MPPRGRGGKFSKPTRGGGKHFSRDLQPLDKEGNPLGMWRDPADKKDESSEEEEDSSEEEESSDDAGPSGAAGGAAQQEMTREERRAAAKAKKEAAIARRNKKVAAPGDLPSSESEEVEEDDMPGNPNHTAKSRSQAAAVPTAADPNAAPAPSKKRDGDVSNLSRREREALQAQQARERYQKLHSEGKTDEARADLERLKLVRERREAEAARKAAEKEERDEREKQTETERLAREAKLRAAAMGGTEAKKGGKPKGKK